MVTQGGSMSWGHPTTHATRCNTPQHTCGDTGWPEDLEYDRRLLSKDFCPLWSCFETIFPVSIHIFTHVYRPTQSMIYVHLLVTRFQQSILCIVWYKCSTSCYEDFMFQDLILHTRLCSTSFISQHFWVVDFHLINMIRRKYFVPVRYQISKGKSARLALE